MRIAAPGSADHRHLPHAGELFTDRVPESQAFKLSLAKFRQRLESDHDPGIARHNVLTFYGLGGIGKTALSLRLESWVRRELGTGDAWGHPPLTHVDATARIDLHGSGGQVDIVDTLLALRSGISRISKRWPVFDLALAAYWSAVRPGVPLPAINGSDELSDTIADTAKDLVADAAALGDLAMGGVGAGIGVKAVKKIIAIARHKRDLRSGVRAYAGFEDFLLKCADLPNPDNPQPTIACDVAGVLAWELSQRPAHPILAVFIDTAERLELDQRRKAESELNLLVHSMPNVLFVMTGRNFITWFQEDRVDLPYRGAHVWPGLVPGGGEEPRQHLVGNLSPSDTREVIRRARTQLDLPLDDDVVEQVADASGGLPQYLELARQVAVTIKGSGTGRRITAADVTGSLQSLVRRVLDDIPPDEQRAIRAACLFRSFDAQLMAAAAGVDHGCAERAARRPMIDRFDTVHFPLRIHDAVREAIRTVDHTVPGGWSDADWAAAASRAVRALRRVHDQAKKDEDSDAALQALGIVINILCEHEVELEAADKPTYEDWVSRAIVYGPSLQGLRPLVPAVSSSEYGKHALDFIAAKSSDLPVDTRLELLRGILHSAHPLRFPAGRHLGYTLRAVYRWDEALQVFEELATIAPTKLHRSQIPQTMSAARRFADARRANLLESAIVTRTERYAHGQPERYFAEVEEKRDKLRRSERRREYLEDSGDLLMRRALFRGDVGEAEVAEYAEEVEAVGYLYGIRCALATRIVQRELSIAEGTRSDLLDRLDSLERATGVVGEIGFRFALAELTDAAVLHDTERLQRLQTQISDIRARSRAWIPVEFFLAKVGFPIHPMPTQWVEPEEIVAGRWGRVLDDYLARYP